MHNVPVTRTIDALCDTFVEDYAALERNRLELELEAAGLSRSRMSALWSGLHEVRAGRRA